MKFTFIIPYNTKFGEKVMLYGSSQELGSFNTMLAIEMEYSQGVWSYTTEMDVKDGFSYSYFISDESGLNTFECGPSRRFDIIDESASSTVIHDEWKPFTNESPFQSDAFRKVFYASSTKKRKTPYSVIIRCPANNLPKGYSLYICGNDPKIGSWRQDKAKQMYKNDEGIWEAGFKFNEIKSPLEYKFILVKREGKSIENAIWENGENRKINFEESPGTNYEFNHFTVNIPASKVRLAGTAIPVFSLRSKNSCGCGDFTDLKRFVDYLVSTNQNVLQILPINDTTMTNTWLDSYPYGAISIFAIHPLYLNVIEVGRVKERSFMSNYKQKCQYLNSLESIDYEAVLKLKHEYLRKIYEIEGDKTLKSKSFIDFYENNREWLDNYSLFCYFRDKYKTADFRTWKEFSVYDKSATDRLISKRSKIYKDIAYYYFIQYHLHIQLSEAHSYANKNGVILKGDIPIGINKNSVEAWVEPHLFNFGGQAGAPPDDFSVRGQNWGFPTYRWDLMEKDGFSWWKNRFSKMSEYFDAYRIDHILGFFRIWEIPSDSVEGIMGYFNPSIPLSSTEIQNRGFYLNEERDTTPYIKEYMLDEYFGINKQSIINTFLEDKDWQTYRFKAELNSQKKVEEYFDKHKESHLIQYKETLFSLLSEVLFIKDPNTPDMFYPRISAQYTKSYQDLSQYQKDSFNSIYNHFFYERNNDFWYNNAMKRLPGLVSSTGMLVCGEDLGMIPSCVPPVMKALSILTLEIQRMPKDPEERFADTNRYPYLSVCTTGTHDTSTLRSWWEENYESSREYYRTMLHEHGDAPYFCEPWLCKKIVQKHLDSPSMLSILPLQDWISIDGAVRRENPHEERINIPSNPKHYWRYRMHIDIDELMDNHELTEEIKEMIKQSGRGVN